MRPFAYQRATDASSATQALAAAASDNNPLTEASIQPLAGGTTLIDLMKLDVMQPDTVVDINPLASQWSTIDLAGGNLRLGALARMSDVAANSRYAAQLSRNRRLAQACGQSAIAKHGDARRQRSATDPLHVFSRCQLRQLQQAQSGIRLRRDGGLQPHPCGARNQRPVHRDLSRRFRPSPDRARCYRRNHRQIRHAQHCLSLNCTRRPANSPQIETTLAPGELISGFTIQGHWPRSVYLKARDRQSYEFALASAAVALDVQDGVVRDARVALGRRRHRSLAGPRGRGAAERSKIR